MKEHGTPYFVSGIDTDCGKTFVTGHLAAHLRQHGVSVITQKPVQTGCVDVAEDIVEHRRVMLCGELPEDRERRTCSYLFPKPASPHLAARMAGETIDLARIDADTRYLCERYDVVLVEGAGGLMVPMTDDVLTVDYVSSRRLPLILVASSRLGGINHALMSVEVCRSRGVDLRLLVFNRVPTDDVAMADDALEVITRHAKGLYPELTVVDFRSSDSFWGIKL